jgi:hypothetical protein
MKKSILILSMAALTFASCSSDDSNPVATIPVADGGIITPITGGPNQGNQVYVDLSTGVPTAVRRDSWDFGFSSGNEYRVILNGSIKMAVKQLATTNIDEVQEEDTSVNVGFSTSSTLGYVDNPTGILSGNGGGEGTAIADISANDADNKVYLVNMGHKVGTATPNPGSEASTGDPRGWKKVRILRNGNNGYKIQYADLNATTHQEQIISKDPAHNFTFFSLDTQSVAAVEPAKDAWDVNFTTFTNYFPYQGAFITYYYADFVTTNMHGGTKVYEVLTSEFDYDTFALNNVDNNKFTASATDQRLIGSGWRNGGGPSSGPSIKDDRFYVVKDVAGNTYKLQFLALTNDAGERGNPVFEYKLLN